ncbi:MAG: bifunctional (p)ppGpp synthetase/guanosine-3',5'-bis(diphosphate) 3'-pyrophosphohydrolase, partial [Clostridia bacterium]|nr:bifunctional (p)ppGpp synthetase/guanosine-3',5'-bis(diphosphate) 3'-pyrophosphohydrolase [Clostridia bacterium]
VGYVTRGRGVSVHRADCKNVQSLMQEADRMIEVEWAMDEHTSFSATIRVFIEDKPGSLMEVSKVLLNLNVNMTDLSSRSTEDGYAAMEITCTVSGTEQLQVIISNLKKIKQVVDVFRV